MEGQGQREDIARVEGAPEDPDVACLRSALGAGVGGAAAHRGQVALLLAPESLLEAARICREELGYEVLLSVCGVDCLELDRPHRFEVVYELLSISRSRRLRLKVPARGDPPRVPTLIPVWAGANWHERETHELVGVGFEGHPNLEPLILPEDFVGHPHRRDFDVGAEEVAFTFRPNPKESQGG
ncbi:MAG: NADH-quinone oxidoreductase subunit C [Nitrospinota bacterium]